MPDYTVRDPKSGRTLTVRGASPPTERELEELFAAATTRPSGVQQLQGGMQRISSIVPDLVGGARAGLMRSAYAGGDAIRRLFGIERIIDDPVSQANMQAPESVAGTVGLVGERAIEFLRPLSLVSSAVRGAPIVARMAANATAGGGVAALQSGGEPIETFMGAAGGAVLPPVSAGMHAIGGGVKRAAAGAQEGGLGGALASLVRSAAPDDPHDMITRALKPRATLTHFPQSLARAMPEIKAAETTLGRPIATIDDLLEATRAAKQDIQAQLGRMRGPLHAMGAEVDLSPVADAMVSSIPKKIQLLQPGEAARLAESANSYRRAFSLEDAEALLRETNAELDGFYAQFPGAQRAALAANPGVASLEAQARALRDVIYTSLDTPGQGEAARELNRRYGALLDVEGEVYRRSNVAKRQQPESLSEQIGAVRAAGQIARGVYKATRGHPVEGTADILGGMAGRSVAKSIKESQTTDALIRRAFAAHATARVPVPIPAHRPVRALLGPGARRMPPAPDPSGRIYDLPIPITHPGTGQRALPPGRGAKPEFHLPGETQPDPSVLRTIPAAPLAYHVDPTISVKAGGFRVAQYASDPEAAAAAVARPEVRAMLQRMARDLEEFAPQRGRLITDPADPTSARYAHGGPGSPVGDDIRVISEQNVSNRQIQRAIDQLLAGQRPSNRLHTAALDAAEGYLEKRSGYRGPWIPDDFDQRPSAASGDDDGFDAFSRAVDELAEEP